MDVYEKEYSMHSAKRVDHLGCSIIAWERQQDFGKEVMCHIRRNGVFWINLGGCNDGGKLTAVNHGINQDGYVLNEHDNMELRVYIDCLRELVL